MRAVERLSSDVRKATPVLGEAQQARQRARLVDAVGARSHERSSRIWFAAFGALALVACLVGGFAWLRTPQVNAVVDEHWWTDVSVVTKQTVSDRGVLELAERSSAHLKHSGTDVQVVLDSGQATSTVVPRNGTRWDVRAGAYLVRAVGTRFSVAYQPAEQRLSVHVSEGRVEVTGGQLGAALVALEPGQSLSVLGSHVSIQRREGAGVEQEASASEPDPSQDALPRASAGESPRRAAPPAAESAATATEPTWLELHARGDHQRALERAKSIGFEQLVGSLGCQELAELGDVARLARDGARAEQALVQLRARCRNTAGGLRAAFLLGRLKDETSPAEAAAWYERYLTEAPADRFADQALGRLISAEQRAGRKDRARAAAQRYLKLYPAGSYAELAQSLAQP
jgi:hypothetical protein